jgi:hypothetical protein
MGIEEAPTPEHWNYFLALEDDVDRLSRYLEPTQVNFPAYSLELARILFGAASEIDVVAKRLCEQISENSQADNIVKYREKIVAHYPQITEARVHLPKFGLTLNPWQQWGVENSPFWWKAYNNVKHHRHTHFADANLKNSLNATAALFVLLLFFYKAEAQQGRLNPNPRLFRAGTPFQVDNPFYAPHTFTYQLLPAG